MTVDAIVLAGALSRPPLTTVSDEPLEALIPVAGRPMIQWVISALRASAAVDRIVIVGPMEDLRERVTGEGLIFVNSADTILNNVKRGLSQIPSARRALVVTADIPLLTARAVDDFLARCLDDSVQVYYSIVRRDVIEAAYSNIDRTYVTLRDGTFTGGNILLLDSDIFDRYGDVIDRVIALRKKPLEMGRLLGLRCIIKFIFRRLSVTDIERRVHRMLGLRGKGVASDYPEIGIDVDKPEDHIRVEEILRQR